MQLSTFGNKFTSRTGILSLMDDLGAAMAKRDALMLGGGNPAHIPEVQARLRARMQRILDTPGEFERVVGNYDPPSGNRAFREALARLLRNEFGWPIGADNIALTNGSQSTFFMLFSLFACPCDDGVTRKVLLPLAPEYIGYADVGLTQDFFVAGRPNIEIVAPHRFKYHVDFEVLAPGDDIGALCVSRPTNPTGNVLSDGELERVAGIAAERGLPLIVDNAYGTPFPHIIFTDARPRWDANTIVTMSLSKLGLPGLRTGIVIAREEIVEAIAGVNAILNLATGGMGAALALDLVQSGEILALSRDVIRPYYRQKAHAAVALLEAELEGHDFFVHEPEGAIFLWLWFRDLPVSCETLYQRLKRRKVLVIAGHHFFPGLAPDLDGWRHRHECIRVTYSQPQATVEAGLRIIAEEVRRAYREGS